MADGFLKVPFFCGVCDDGGDIVVRATPNLIYCWQWNCQSCGRWWEGHWTDPLPEWAEPSLTYEIDYRTSYDLCFRRGECDCGGPPNHVPNGIHCRRPHSTSQK